MYDQWCRGANTANEDHLTVINEGVAAWNRWRQENAETRPELSRANLGGKSLSKANLGGANLVDADLHDAYLYLADLSGASLNRANLRNADLGGASLRKADLSGADIQWANISEADLRGATLRRANLAGSNLSETHFEDADLTGCHIYGISAWNLTVNENTKQSDLIVTRPDESTVTVDDIEVGQFIYLLLNRRKLRDVITALGEKAVLILGRFTERKDLLDSIATKLRDLKYLPIIFDFERPTHRDVTETVKVLAGLSCFVIADITNPRSVALELDTTVPDYMVPFVTILQRGQPAFGMFDDLPRKYHWALPLLEYNSAETLLAAFKTKVIAPALEKREQVRQQKALLPVRRSAED